VRTFFLASLLSLLTASAASADDWAPTSLSATWENDLFGGSDRHYTNGAELALTGRVPKGALSFFLGEDGGEWRLSLAQSIYTPERLDARNLVLDDRPYAGWLRLGLSLSHRSTRWPIASRVGLELGVLGPPSGAEAAQRLFHGSLTGSSPPQGWGHQIPTEVGLRFHYELSYRAWREVILGADWELEPRFACSFGNVTIDASLGARLRVGRLPDAFATAEPPRWSAFVTLGGRVRFVGHDVFLNGSLLRPGGHRVRRRHLVVDLEAGFTIEVLGALALTYSHTLRAPEFVGQDGWDQFGSLSLTWSW